jgi:excisionase family DNA binding protein
MSSPRSERIGQLVRLEMGHNLVGDGTWLTVGEAAAKLGVGEETVRRYADSGRLDAPVKSARLAGGHRRLHKDSVERMRREMYGSPDPDRSGE